MFWVGSTIITESLTSLHTYLFDSHAMRTIMKGGQVCKEWLEFTAASSFDGQRFCNSDIYGDMSAFSKIHWYVLKPKPKNKSSNEDQAVSLRFEWFLFKIITLIGLKISVLKIPICSWHNDIYCDMFSTTFNTFQVSICGYWYISCRILSYFWWGFEILYDYGPESSQHRWQYSAVNSIWKPLALKNTILIHVAVQQQKCWHEPHFSLHCSCTVPFRTWLYIVANMDIYLWE